MPPLTPNSAIVSKNVSTPAVVVIQNIFGPSMIVSVGLGCCPVGTWKRRVFMIPDRFLFYFYFILLTTPYARMMVLRRS
jgi:hypothetical protein